MTPHEKAAELLLEAGRGGVRLPDLPDELQPKSLDEAYAIQDAALRQQGEIGGWKVGPTAKKEGRFCTAVPASRVLVSPASLPGGSVVAPEVETEIAVQIGHDLLARADPYSADEVAAAIGTVHPAFEVLDSRFVDRKSLPALVLLADQQSNAGIVYGASTATWSDVEFGNVQMKLAFDGTEVGAANGGPSSAVILEALTFLANEAARRHGGLKRGQMVITGARIKPKALPPGVAAEATMPGLGSVRLVIGA